MRILFVNRMMSLERGGGETFDSEIAVQLAEQGCHISCLSGLPLFSNAHLKRKPVVSVQRASSDIIHEAIRSPFLGWIPWDKVKGGWRLRLLDFWCFEQLAARWVRRKWRKYDVIQVCELPLFVHLWKQWNIPVPVVMRLTAGNYFDPYDAVRKADGIIASGMTISQLRKGIRCDAVNVPNAVDSNRFFPHTSPFRAQYGFSSDEVLLLYVARFQAFKNHAFLLEAFRRVVSEYPKARLIFAGRGPLESRCKKDVNDLGLGTRVSFLGEVPFHELPDIYAACDIKVVSSTFESFCFAALEAMATSLPIVTTACGWVPYLIGHGSSSPLEKQDFLLEDAVRIRQLPGGFVVSNDDAVGFAQAVLSLINNPDLRLRMGQSNRLAVEHSYSWPSSANALLELYDSLSHTQHIMDSRQQPRGQAP